MATAKNYLYINIDGKAKKIGKFYYDVEGLAKKVEKAYIRDENGKAMLAYVAHVHSWSYSYTYYDNSSHSYKATCSCGDSLSGYGTHIDSTARCSGWHTNTSKTKHYDHYKCKYCGCCNSQATSHNINWVYQSTTATCTSSGYDTYKCANCTTTKTEYSDALGHSWADATCTTPKTCRRCRKTEGSALGHTGGTATCTARAICTRSGCNQPYGTALGHDWAAATCTTPQTCKRSGCGATTGSALGHTGGTATCTEKAICAKCDQPYGTALGHNWDINIDNWITKKATCTKNGYNIVPCTKCTATKRETISALGHNYQLTATYEATCISSGYDEYTCSRCKDVDERNYTSSDTVNGHEWAKISGKWQCIYCNTPKV